MPGALNDTGFIKSNSLPPSPPFFFFFFFFALIFSPTRWTIKSRFERASSCQARCGVENGRDGGWEVGGGVAWDGAWGGGGSSGGGGRVQEIRRGNG